RRAANDPRLPPVPCPPLRRPRDPCVQRAQQHQLSDLLVIALCATLADCDSWYAIEDFGNDKFDWLGSFLELHKRHPVARPLQPCLHCPGRVRSPGSSPRPGGGDARPSRRPASWATWTRPTCSPRSPARSTSRCSSSRRLAE